MPTPHLGDGHPHARPARPGAGRVHPRASGAGGTVITAGLRVRELPPGSSLRVFIDLPWRVNAGDPLWVPPLRSVVAHALDRRKHPFHRHADVAYFLAERDGEPVGRIAAIVNHRHNEFHGERTGFFGLFESEDSPETAGALFDAACAWLRERRMVRVRGPVNFSTNEEIASPGVLVDGFDTPPFVMMTHNPRYYGALIEGSGLEKVKDLFAFHFDDPTPPPRLARSMERVLQHGGATVRPLDLKRFRREVDTIKEIYNSAWSRNWGFVPMTDAEFEHMAKEFRPVVDPALCVIAEKEGEAVGFLLALPDLNEALRHVRNGRLFPFGLIRFLWHRRKIRGVRVITLGIRPEYQHLGLGAALYQQAWLSGLRRGYDRGEASWILEDNLDMVRPLEKLGARMYKTYRIYEREL